jgi:hypothetical protein
MSKKLAEDVIEYRDNMSKNFGWDRIETGTKQK